MAAGNPWGSRLQKMAGCIVDDWSPTTARPFRSTSPSVNFVFGNKWGLPPSTSVALFGLPKGGKSLLCKDFIGKMHQEDPEAIAVVFDTEYRWRSQLTPQQAAVWGIDRERLFIVESNRPEDIFDAIEGTIAAECQKGAPIKMVIIDSLANIRGRRDINADSIAVQQVGDSAKTISDGLKRVSSILKQHRISTILTDQVRAELDMWEQKRGNNVKMASSWYVKHFAEFFLFAEPLNTVAGRTDAMGNEFVDKSLTDMNDKGEKTGHKIRVTMKDSSIGPKGRVGVLTLDYNKGIINTYEEVFQLGINRGVIERPNNVTYVYGGNSYRGKEAMLTALRDNQDLYDAVLKQVMVEDMEGRGREVTQPADGEVVA